MSQTFRILLVEDNELDIRMIVRGMKNTDLTDNLEVVHEGQAALDKLNGSATKQLPDIVLLDLSLPGIGGLELLQILKSDSRYRRIPILILTSSAAKVDIDAAYDGMAAAFFTKPVDMAGFADIMAAIESFYIDQATLPAKC